jgi:hypothetical protein
MGSRRTISSNTLPLKPQGSKPELTNLFINTDPRLKLTTCTLPSAKVKNYCTYTPLPPFAPVAITKKTLDQIFVTYKCWTKINKLASRFTVQIYLSAVSVKIQMK